MANDFKVEAIINTGSAGAVAPGMAVGDIVLADKLAYHDVDVTAFGYKYGQMAGQPLYFESSRYFVSEMKKVLEEEAATTHVGLITTGDSFIASEEKSQQFGNISQKYWQLRWKERLLPSRSCSWASFHGHSGYE